MSADRLSVQKAVPYLVGLAQSTPRYLGVDLMAAWGGAATQFLIDQGAIPNSTDTGTPGDPDTHSDPDDLGSPGDPGGSGGQGGSAGSGGQDGPGAPGASDLDTLGDSGGPVGSGGFGGGL